MDVQAIAAIIFFLLMGLFLVARRKKIQVQNILPNVLSFILYRTKVGLSLMNSIAEKQNKLVRWAGYVGIVLGFVGMAFISYALINNIYQLLVAPSAAPSVGLVLPFRVKGAFYVPFFYWILSIFIIALVHEFSHGVVARAHGIKVKSSGLAFLSVGGIITLVGFAIYFTVNSVSYRSISYLAVVLALLTLAFRNPKFRKISSYFMIPVIPAAFVEPDEKKIVKKSARAQLSVFAAGPFSNIALGILFLLVLMFLGAPLIQSVLDFDGVIIHDFIRDGDNMTLPAEAAGITKGEIVQRIGDTEVDYLFNFSNILQNKTPGDEILLVTDKGEYNITLTNNPENENRSYLGVYVQQSSNLKQSFIDRYGLITAKIVLWFTGSPGKYGLIFWLYVLNLGIGLFNLVPVGPLDGGRMLNVVLGKFLEKKKAQKIWGWISLFFLALILINIFASFIR
jgi:membrane-associated protease RseP (regulator of RpoE activity)